VKRLGPLGWGLIAGVWAGLAMALVSLLLRLVAGVSIHSELVGDLVLPHLPVDRFLALLNQLGGPLHAKDMAILGDVPGLVGAGIACGLLYAFASGRAERTPRPGRSRTLFVITAVTVGWLISTAVFWPVLGASYLGLPAGPAVIATSLGLLLTYATYGGALLLFDRLRRTSPAAVRDGSLLSRRNAILAGSGILMAAATGGLVKVLRDESSLSYDGYRTTSLLPVTPTADFYVVTKNLIDPKVNAEAWRLEVTGLVERPATYSLQELRSLTATEHEVTLECISNSVGAGLISNALWRGVSLPALLSAAGLKPGIRTVNLHGADGYLHTTSLEEAMDPAALVAYEMNGAQLPDRHGYPARVLMPRNYGEVSVKWLTRIDLSGTVDLGYYESQGWQARFVHTTSRFSSPKPGAALSGRARLQGIAYAAGRGIAGVEVSTDAGQSWRPARIDYAGTKATWSLWSFDWTPSGAGNHELVVRATDGDGMLQPEPHHGISPSGAAGYHRITVGVA